MSRTDINKVAETILVPLLAEVYGYTELKNLNSSEYPNYPAIDLGDETARVAFQITSTSGREKIKKTLRKFVEHELYEKYDKLIIYILTEKPDSSGKDYEEIIQGKFNFDKDKDIWDYRDILREVANFQIEKVRRVESILEANFGQGRTLAEWEVVDNVERIVSEDSQLFVGREEESQQLNKFLSENSSGVMLVTAGAGFGKTALLANWVNAWRDKDCFIAYHFFTQRYHSLKSAYRNLLRQLYIYYKPTYEQIPNDEEELKIRLYNLLREYAAPEGEPLIIVIDGLDEAENTFSPPFPNPLPENVFVIASARAEEGEEPKYLEYWIDNSQPLNLKRLSGGGIAEWLRNMDKLAAFAEDTDFVAQLDEITQGFPLYLRHLTEELIQAQQKGEDVQVVLTRSPKGFGAYVQEQFKQLAQVEEIRRHREVRELFALLSVALGVLSEDDIQELTALNEWDLAALPWQATRWFSIQTGFYSFAHPLLAQEFQRVLGRQASSAKDKLIRYCSCWQEHQRRYALRHYAEHLHEVKRWEELYAIARKKDFASAQQKHLPDEPDLPLKTVQAALLGAAEKDDAGAMADFMLVHARRLEQTTVQESPLDALRSGNLSRAQALADLYEIERCALWYLLLAWELKDTQQLSEAQATLEKLRQKKLVRGFSLSGVGTYGTRASYGEYAAYLLAYVSDINKAAFTELTQRLLDDYQQVPLCKTLTVRGRGHLTTALETALSMDDGWSKVQALANIAVAQAQDGDKVVAQNTLNFIFETAQPTDDKWSSIAAAQAKLGDFDAALNTVQKIDNKVKQVRALGEIATAQAQVAKADLLIFWLKGCRAVQFAQLVSAEKLDLWFITLTYHLIMGRAVKANLDSALEIAHEVDEQQRAYALQKVAIAQAEAGYLDDALETANETGWKSTRQNVLMSTVRIYAQVGNIEAALKIAEQIRYENPKDFLAHSRALEPIAETFAQNGNLNAALSVVAMSYDQARVIGLIAAKVAQIGATQVARDLFTLFIKTTTWLKPPQQKQVEAIGAIAQVYAELGQRKKAQATFAKALEIAQKINDQGSRDWALQTITEIQVKNGDPTEAWNTVQMLKSRGRQQTVPIALAYAQAGDKDMARAILATALERADEVDAEKSKGFYLREIAKGQAQIGDFTTARETAKHSSDEVAFPEVLATIAQKQRWDGK
ncbi:MAG TPA: SMEK domain-containing protein, partial [Coleofasciculaceae cyanobacterium]